MERMEKKVETLRKAQAEIVSNLEFLLNIWQQQTKNLSATTNEFYICQEEKKRNIWSCYLTFGREEILIFNEDLRVDFTVHEIANFERFSDQAYFAEISELSPKVQKKIAANLLGTFCQIRKSLKIETIELNLLNKIFEEIKN